MTIRKNLHHLYLASMAVLLVACATEVPGGHLKEDEQISAVHPGVTTKAEVQKALGSPSSASTFGPPTWYYVSSIQKTRSLLPTEVVDQHVIEIAFDSAGTVQSMKQYTLKDGKKVEIESEITPSEGQQLGFFEQIISNLGRFNNNNADSTSNNHGSHLPVPGSGGYPR